MILLRATSVSPQTARFAERLIAESGHAVCFVLDGRRGEVDARGFDNIQITNAGCRALGLYPPFDVAWRCGDYSFYLARQRFPDEPFLWLMEYDVRLGGSDLGRFFDIFAGAETDLIAPDYREADRRWYWHHAMAARDQRVWRCFFPVVRLSARAIDVLLDARRAHGRQWRRRATWPNDESFVATVTTRAGLRCADLNGFGRKLYETATFSYHTPIDGGTMDEREMPLQILHPVLYDDDLRRKIRHMVRIDKGESWVRKVKRRILTAINTRLPA